MYFAKFRHIRYLSHLLHNLTTKKKQSFLENKFEYFESLKNCNINFKMQFVTNSRRIKYVLF